MLGRVMEYQILINCIFFFTVAYFFNLAIIFNVPYSGPISLILFNFASLHSFADTAVILYAITPYRRYCLSVLEKFGLIKKNQTAIATAANIVNALNKARERGIEIIAQQGSKRCLRCYCDQ